jgi:hypothetical protein
VFEYAVGAIEVTRSQAELGAVLGNVLMSGDAVQDAGREFLSSRLGLEGCDDPAVLAAKVT